MDSYVILFIILFVGFSIIEMINAAAIDKLRMKVKCLESKINPVESERK